MGREHGIKEIKTRVRPVGDRERGVMREHTAILGLHKHFLEGHKRNLGGVKVIWGGLEVLLGGAKGYKASIEEALGFVGAFTVGEDTPSVLHGGGRPPTESEVLHATFRFPGC